MMIVEHLIQTRSIFLDSLTPQLLRIVCIIQHAVLNKKNYDLLVIYEHIYYNVKLTLNLLLYQINNANLKKIEYKACVCISVILKVDFTNGLLYYYIYYNLI